jgi:disulfide bond formation protein DsbB
MKVPLTSSTARLWAMAAICVGAVGAALVTQYVFDMQPCPWCILQRVIFLAIAIVCVPAALLRAGGLRRALAALAALLASLGAAVALYQHFVAAKSTSCNLTLADRIVGALGLESLSPEVFRVMASCADAAVSIAGIPYEFWSLTLFVLLTLAALLTLNRRGSQA